LALLRSMVSVSVARTTGVVEVGVSSKWRSVSLAIARALIDHVNDYNRRTRQQQASSERKFVESRLTVANSDLREAEGRLEQFEQSNRDYARSPSLSLQRDRLSRDVLLRQQVYTSLNQAYEDARIREVRDTPVISMFEEPYVPTHPDPRGRVRRLIVGVLAGAVVGATLALISAAVSRRRKSGDEEAAKLVATLDGITDFVFAAPVGADAIENTRRVADGVVVPQDDPPALARSLLALLGDREKAASIGEAGRQRARAHFDFDRAIAPAYERLYATLIAKRPR
jgi:hypothetical protein